MNPKKCDRNYQYVSAAQEGPKGFCASQMTALSLKTPSTSRYQIKTAVSPRKCFASAISVGYDTDLYDKNSFNNYQFDSAVFSQTKTLSDRAETKFIKARIAILTKLKE